MIERLTPPIHVESGRQQASRVLDTAVGILVGWRGCGTDKAFRELVDASVRHAIPVFALASALVALASHVAASADPAAQRAAEKEWGPNQLLASLKGA